jgi:rubrerythrin
MERQVLMDKLSEFLMVEQGGWELYHIALSRAANPETRERYQEFAEQTNRHRTVLIQLIQRLGGDPSYVSPTARVAQLKAASLLETAIRADGLSEEELEANDLENVLLAETKDHANWHLLEQLVQHVDDQQVRMAVEEAVQEVEPQEDNHLEWARITVSQMSLRMILQGPPPAPERWEHVLSGPVPPIHQIHSESMPEDGDLLETARQSPWQETIIVRQAHRG